MKNDLCLIDLIYQFYVANMNLDIYLNDILVLEHCVE